MSRQTLTDYSPERQAEFNTLADNLANAFETFRTDRSIDNGKTERAVYDALMPYEAIVPSDVRPDLAREYRKSRPSVFAGNYELAFGIRLRLEQIHNACAADK